MSVAVDAVAVAALHGKRLQAILILTADVTHEAWYDFQPGSLSGTASQPSSLEDLLGLVHVLVDKPLLVPPEITEHDGRILFGEFENHVHFIDEVILLFLNILWLEDFIGNIKMDFFLWAEAHLAGQLLVGLLFKVETCMGILSVACIQRGEADG
jgi:hypothetical protein